MNETTFPTLFRIAMDYLPIQATSVPSERIFSSSSETDTKKRNRIHPILMEALQMLKCGLKNNRLDFGRGLQTSENMLYDDEPDVTDLLSGLLEGSDVQAVMDKIIGDISDEDDGGDVLEL
jgi:hypothetical protein